jgi:hypothetical protein
VALSQAAQLGQWRQQEALALNQVIAGVAQNETEKLLTRTCIQRLAERVRAGLGAEMDHDLLARFLTRDVRLKGRLIQIVDRPALSLSAWEGSGFPVEGVAAVLRPLAALDGSEARLGSGDIYISGGRVSGGKACVGAPIHAEELPIAPGLKTLSCMVEVQLVQARPGETIGTGARAANYQPIGNPVRIVLPSIERFFVRQSPPNYPVEILDEPAAQLISDRFAVSQAAVSSHGSQGCTCEVEFYLPQLYPSFPIALSVDLLEFAGISIQTHICGILVDERESASLAESAAVQTLGTEVACLPDDVRYKIKFVVPGVQSLSLESQTASARFRIRASLEVARSAENLEHFLSIPEFTKVVGVTLNSRAQH